jgi:dTDP-glucose pyrophosphorylase
MKPIVLVLMAGNGTRFSKAGYTAPKPLIEFLNKTMIEHVLDSVNINADYVFLVQQNHIDEFQIDQRLNAIKPNSTIVSTGGGVTEGAACSALLAKAHIDNNRPLFLLNSDNILDWNAAKVTDAYLQSESDGFIAVFRDSDPKWSFAKLDEHGNVIQVAEKNPISDLATAGLYGWKKGSSFVKAAEQMIEKNIRVNNEFYVAPVYNENVLMGEKITVGFVDKMHGVGTPEDLNIYLAGKE